jgi:hypothetical protein
MDEYEKVSTPPSLQGIYNYLGETPTTKVKGIAYFNGKKFFPLSHTDIALGELDLIKVTHWRKKHEES